jgi:hypothetical protein
LSELFIPTATTVSDRAATVPPPNLDRIAV